MGIIGAHYSNFQKGAQYMVSFGTYSLLSSPFVGFNWDTFQKNQSHYAQSSYPSMTDKRSRAHCVRLLGRQDKCLKCSDHSRSPHRYVILRRTKLMPIWPENMVRRSVIPRVKKASYAYREFMRFSTVERRCTTRCVVLTT